MNFIARTLTIALLSIGVTTQASMAFAQDDAAEARRAAAKKVQELLANTDDVFFKVREGNDGNTFFNILFERDGVSTKIVLNLKQLGYYNGDYKFSASFWTEVYRGETPIPPAAIKAVATLNDRTTIGHLSCSRDFKVIYSNATGTLEGATPASIWFYCAYLASNKAAMEEEVKAAFSASGR